MAHLDRYRGRDAIARAYAVIEIARRRGISAEAAADLYDRADGKPELIENLVRREAPTSGAGGRTEYDE